MGSKDDMDLGIVSPKEASKLLELSIEENLDKDILDGECQLA